MGQRAQRCMLLALLLTVVLMLCKDYLASLRLKDSRRRASSFTTRAGDRKHEEDTAVEPANATLGFGSVMAVSRRGSPRRKNLVLAANITEIDITIPAQPHWTDRDIANLRTERASTVSRGSALAWLGHLNALRAFLAGPQTTALIIEDDVDWDIHLRTIQIPVTASAFRSFAAASKPDGLDARDEYWGNTSTWDILWLGTCGDYFPPSKLPRLSFTYIDPTSPSLHQLQPQTSDFLSSLKIRPPTRLLHPTIFPLCTFGYAVTRLAAERLLDDVAARESEGGTVAYDVRLLEACRDLGMRCWTVAPELMRHLDAESEISDVDMGENGRSAAAGNGASLDPRAGTVNIGCGVRSNTAFVTDDPERLDYLKDVVGRHGICLQEDDPD